MAVRQCSQNDLLQEHRQNSSILRFQIKGGLCWSPPTVNVGTSSKRNATSMARFSRARKHPKTDPKHRQSEHLHSVSFSALTAPLTRRFPASQEKVQEAQLQGCSSLHGRKAKMPTVHIPGVLGACEATLLWRRLRPFRGIPIRWGDHRAPEGIPRWGSTTSRWLGWVVRLKQGQLLWEILFCEPVS